jgi:hypothetical protein
MALMTCSISLIVRRQPRISSNTTRAHLAGDVDQQNPSLISNGAYGFNFHGGPGYLRFRPHMTVICAVTPVLGIYHPASPPYAPVVAAIALGLLGADYHFVSDIIAGVLLGTVTGWLAVAVQEQAANKLTSVNPTPK